MCIKIIESKLDQGYSLSSMKFTVNINGNRSQFTVIGSRLKKQKKEKNYGVLF